MTASSGTPAEASRNDDYGPPLRALLAMQRQCADEHRFFTADDALEAVQGFLATPSVPREAPEQRIAALSEKIEAAVERMKPLAEAAKNVVAYWDLMDSVSEHDPRPTEHFKDNMDARISALRSAAELYLLASRFSPTPEQTP